MVTRNHLPYHENGNKKRGDLNGKVDIEGNFDTDYNLDVTIKGKCEYKNCK